MILFLRWQYELMQASYGAVGKDFHDQGSHWVRVQQTSETGAGS